jgi:hypothetical protein
VRIGVGIAYCLIVRFPRVNNSVGIAFTLARDNDKYREFRLHIILGTCLYALNIIYVHKNTIKYIIFIYYTGR